MTKIFKRICLPLLHVNSNVYTFLSGIMISLATNIFTTICIDEEGFSSQWCLYLSAISFAIVSAVLMLIASKIEGVQNFINFSLKDKTKEWREKMYLEATLKYSVQWVIKFFILFAMLISGIVFLIVNVA